MCQEKIAMEVHFTLDTYFTLTTEMLTLNSCRCKYASYLCILTAAERAYAFLHYQLLHSKYVPMKVLLGMVNCSTI